MWQQTTTTVAETNIDETISNTVSSYTNLIDTYGASAVIIGVFIIIILILLLYLIRNNKKVNDQMMNQQSTLLDKLTDTNSAMKQHINQDGKRCQLDNNADRDVLKTIININSQLKSIIDAVKLDQSRISIYVFHNGTYSSSGLPFFKISCVYEDIKKNCGVVKKIDQHKNISLDLIDDQALRDLYKTGIIQISDMNEYEMIYPVIVGMLRSNNIMSGLIITIYDNTDNNVIGLLTFEYSTIKSNEDLESILPDMTATATQLSSILDYNRKFINKS